MIFEILGLSIIANLITHWFEPIQGIKTKLLLFINNTAFTTILTCPKCLGLYLGVIYSAFCSNVFSYPLPFLHFLLFGAVVSLTSYLIKFLIDYIEVYYEQ